MNRKNADIAADLIEVGTLVEFSVNDTHTELSPDKENISVKVEMTFETDEEYDDPSDVVEWAAFGFIFVLAFLSFADSRPRGMSEIEFRIEDEFGIKEYMECLSFSQGELHFNADYIRGRSMKTSITVRSDGKVTMTTWGRGEAVLRWLDKLKGKKLMKVV
jgi:hypothetical protein